jgi:hypothetical protein
MRDDRRQIGELVIDDRQFALGGEIAQHRGDRFALLEDAFMAPGMRPEEPALHPLPGRDAIGLDVTSTSVFLPAQDGQAEEIVEPAAIDPDDDDLAAVEDLVEGQLSIGPALPVFGAAPAIASQREADLDIEVLGEKADDFRSAGALGLGELLGQVALIDRGAEIGVGDIPEAGSL